MKKPFPVFALVFLIGAEACLKEQWHFSVVTTWIYLAVLVAALLVLAKSIGESEPSSGSSADPTFSSHNEYIWIGLIVLAALALRFYKLTTLFDGMTFDEAYKGLDGIAIREFGERPIFLNWNGGREALVAYLVASLQYFWGISIGTVRTVTPVLSVVAVVFFYFLARELFNKNTAILATLLMAFSKYAIIHGRYGVRAGQYLAFEIAALYFTARALRSEKRSWAFVPAGIALGIGFYTYIAFRIFPVVLLVFLCQKGVLEKLRRSIVPLIAGLALAAIIIAPLAAYYVQNRQSFTDRMNRTLVWKQKTRQGQSPAGLLLGSTLGTLGMFNYQGDDIARHNVFTEPMLSPFASGFFLLGLMVCLVRYRKRHSVFLVLYLLIALLPGILSVGAPNAPRVIGSIPPALLITALGMTEAFGIVAGSALALARPCAVIVISGCLFTGWFDSMIRFPAILDDLPVKTAEIWGMDREPQRVADLMNRLGSRCRIYLSPQFFFHSTVEYLTYSKTPHSLFTANSDLEPGKVSIVVTQPSLMNLWWLRDDDGKNFFKWWVQSYGLQVPKIRALNHSTYDNYMTNSSDRKLIRSLLSRYPSAKEVDLGTFSVYIVRVK